MALQISYTTQYGVDFAEAYARITTFRGDATAISVVVEVHVHKAARDLDRQPIDRVTVMLPLDNGSKFAGMYTALKLDPRFSASLDV